MRILVQPPALEQAEGRVREQTRGAHLVQQDRAIALERRLRIAKRASDIAGGVQHVGGDDDVELADTDALRCRRAFDIESRIAHVRRPLAVLALRSHDECLREVGEAIVGDDIRVRRQRPDQRCRRAAGARADLEDPQADIGIHATTAFDVTDDHRAQRTIEEIGDRAVAVDALHQVRRGFREQDVGRLALAAQHGPEFAQRRFRQLHRRGRVRARAPLRCAALPFFPWRCGRRWPDKPPRAVTLDDQTALREQIHRVSQPGAVLRNDTAFLRGL